MKIFTRRSSVRILRLWRHCKLFLSAFAIAWISLLVIHILAPQQSWLERSLAALWLGISFLGTFYAEQRSWKIRPDR